MHMCASVRCIYCAVVTIPSRTGCKPFVEVFQDGERVYTSANHDSMEKIRSFHADDGGVEVPLGVGVRGNMVVVLHHIRAIPVARKAGMVSSAVTYLISILMSSTHSLTHIYTTG